MFRTAPAGAHLPLHVRLLNALLPDAAFRALNGSLQDALDSGAVVTTNGWLENKGAPADFRDGYRSWFGRHVADAYRAANGEGDPARAWIRHRTTNYWIPAFVYSELDPALPAGARSYPRTAKLQLAA